MTAEPTRVSLTINGELIEREVDPSLSLMRFLRETLGLAGAKNGCEKGHCGACTVIVDGAAKRSCLLKASKLSGATILTIEGLASPDGKLHPIQAAFVEEGAVQCGFCTPGMIMAAKALLDRRPDPSDAEIDEALKDNLCRCTGYQAIMRAVHRAARSLRGDAPRSAAAAAPSTTTPRAVGAALPRKDAPARARGEALFAEDLSDRAIAPGKGAQPLWGAMLFSAYAHARITRLDASKAEAAPGVALVLTAKDVPGRNAFGLFVPQQPVIAGSEVMYLGDVLAVVLAASREEAIAARGLIEVDYERLPILDSAETNLGAEAPLLHPETKSNVVHETHVRKNADDGALERAFAEADIVIEGEYDTPAVEHAYLEPESCLAIPEEDGGVTVYTGNQGSIEYRDMIAESLGLPKDKVRVILVACGGGFGGKEEPTVQIQAALGALRTGRPVRMALSREESIRMSTKRHPMRLRMAHAAKKDGSLLAMSSYVVADAGAYVSQTAPVVFRSAVTATGPYEVASIKADSFGVYTHRNPSGAFRGFGSTQASFACEIQMDEIARAIGMDPVELRRRSGYAPGKRTGTGQLLDSGVGYLGTLEAAAAGLKRLREEFPAPSAPGKRIGFGIASSYKNVGIGTGLEDAAGAIVGITEEGRVWVRTGAADMGQGSDTVAAQIAAEELALPYELVDVLACDTNLCPDGGMTTASRQTYVTGNAVRAAASELRIKLKPFLSGPEGAARGAALGASLEAAMAFLREAREAAIAAGAAPEVESRYLPPSTRAHRADSGDDGGIHYAYCFASAAVAVEVDLETGGVRALKVVAAQDAGVAINPLAVRGQIEGAVAMGLGYALSESYVSDETSVITDSLRKLGVPRISQVPPIEAIIIETPQPGGPFGAKGMGEVGLNPIAPAVSNAIFDAVGVRLRSLPMTKDKVLEALRAHGAE
jgi:CO/xanthine dehydrogenase Mo-binding subunit/aerobic-type carbon monoxide dehydrogenase small subunit (CoxS/CutS family)